MANIRVINLQSKSIHCKDKREKLLDILLSSVDWMHACGGKGRCTTCKARIIAGNHRLSEPTLAEKKYAKANRLRPDERLTCQVYVDGDVDICAPKEYQLPHQTYLNECL